MKTQRTEYKTQIKEEKEERNKYGTIPAQMEYCEVSGSYYKINYLNSLPLN